MIWDYDSNIIRIWSRSDIVNLSSTFTIFQDFLLIMVSFADSYSIDVFCVKENGVFVVQNHVPVVVIIVYDREVAKMHALKIKH